MANPITSNDLPIPLDGWLWRRTSGSAAHLSDKDGRIHGWVYEHSTHATCAPCYSYGIGFKRHYTTTAKAAIALQNFVEDRTQGVAAKLGEAARGYAEEATGPGKIVPDTTPPVPIAAEHLPAKTPDKPAKVPQIPTGDLPTLMGGWHWRIIRGGTHLSLWEGMEERGEIFNSSVGWEWTDYTTCEYYEAPQTSFSRALHELMGAFPHALAGAVDG